MKETIKIVTSDGREWPCRMTLGAMRRFKAETGRDVSKMEDAADMAVLVWCCVKSACNADGVAMDATLEDFCDRLDVESVEAFAALLGEKKTVKMTRKA